MNLKIEGLILDVGCRPNSNPVNINLDYEWISGVDICCDITRGLPLTDDYVGGIFTLQKIDPCLAHFGGASQIMRAGTGRELR